VKVNVYEAFILTMKTSIRMPVKTPYGRKYNYQSIRDLQKGSNGDRALTTIIVVLDMENGPDNIFSYWGQHTFPDFGVLYSPLARVPQR